MEDWNVHVYVSRLVSAYIPATEQGADTDKDHTQGQIHLQANQIYRWTWTGHE